MKELKDSLTGLPNRPALERRVGQAIEAGTPAALALLDLDSFLDVNVQFGPETGDTVIKAVASLLDQAESGSVYRISGDEFAVLFEGQTLEQAFLSAEALRARVEGAVDQLALPDRRQMTITAGVAQYPRDAKDTLSLLEAADAALFAAKENGRNQVALPPNEEMVMKSCYYPSASVRKLKVLAERLGRKESHLLREALDGLFRKYDIPREA